MAPIFGRPPMLHTRTQGLHVGWRQGLHEKAGVGTLWIDVLGEKEYEFCPVPKMYFNQLRSQPNPEDLMNQLMRMYL